MSEGAEIEEGKKKKACMSGDFKKKYSLEERIAMHSKYLSENEGRVPVVIEKSPRATTMPDISKSMLLVLRDATCAHYIHLIRKRLQLDSTQSLFIYINGNIPSQTDLMSVIYQKNKDEDGILYVTYSGENTFGSA